MSEVVAAAAAAGVAVTADAEADEAGVLGLLEDPGGHSGGGLSAAPNLPLTTTQEHIASIAVSHDPALHQARAAAALQQTDTAAEHHHHHHHHHPHRINPLSQQRTQQGEAGERPPLAGSAQPPPLSPSSSASPPAASRAKEGAGMLAVAPTGAKSIGERSVEPVVSEFGLTPTSPHSICLCQAPARIPRPRNG